MSTGSLLRRSVILSLCRFNRMQRLRRVVNAVPGLWRLNRGVVWALIAVRSEALRHVPRGGVAAEIGVWRGDFSEQILRDTEPSTLHLIDPWIFDEEYVAYGHDTTPPPSADTVRQRFAHDHRVHVHQAFSTPFLQQLTPDSLDWIYIDGDHLYDGVLSDIEWSWRAVKPGGVIVGDDYYWRDPKNELSVGNAVRRFCATHTVGHTVVGTQYVIRKPGHESVSVPIS